LAQLPEDARCFGYEGEDTGISIRHENKFWFIRAKDSDIEDDYVEGEYESLISYEERLRETARRET
jgi:hypothetical protein